MKHSTSARIDSHQHFWSYDPQSYPWISNEMAKIKRDFKPTDLEPVLREHDFEGCISVQAQQSEEETRKLLEMGNQWDFIRGVVGWVDLMEEHVVERLELYSRDKLLKGIRYTVWDKKGEFLRSPEFKRGISALVRFQLTFDLLVFPYQLENAVGLAKDFPDQQFVLNHMGQPSIQAHPSEQWKMAISELGQMENVSCKISGFGTSAGNLQTRKEDYKPVLEHVVEAFGTDRLVFGSDWPVCLVRNSYPQLLELVDDYFADLSKTERAAIFGRNASDLYNLE